MNKKRQLYSSYLSYDWKPSVLFDIEIGIRYNYFASDKDFQSYDPRFSIKYRLADDMNLKFATGIYHQYLDRIDRGFIAGIWATADKYVNGSTANHYILGFQKEFFKSYQLEVEAFYKQYKDIYSLNPFIAIDVKTDHYDAQGRSVVNEIEGVFIRGNGYSNGIEVLFKRDIGALTGWLGYTYSNTKFNMDGINQGKEYMPRHNRTSVINLVANLDLTEYLNNHYDMLPAEYSSRWLLGMNFVYSSGQPITVPSSGYSASSLPNGMSDGPFIYPSAIDNYTLPAYIRMDVSITYEKKFEGWTISPNLQVYNIGNRKNVFFINYKNTIQDNIVKQEVDTFNMLPLLPSVGVNIKF